MEQLDHSLFLRNPAGIEDDLVRWTQPKCLPGRGLLLPGERLGSKMDRVNAVANDHGVKPGQECLEVGACLLRRADQCIAVGQKEPQVVLYKPGRHRSAEGKVVAVGYVQRVGCVQEGQPQAPRRTFAGPAETVLGVGVDDIQLFFVDKALYRTRVHQPKPEFTGAAKGD